MSEEMTKEELKHTSKIGGEVRIPLQNYHELVRSSTEQKQAAEIYNHAVNTIQKFMTMLRSKEEIDMEKLISEFNSKNHNLNMWIDDQGKVRLSLREV